MPGFGQIVNSLARLPQADCPCTLESVWKVSQFPACCSQSGYSLVKLGSKSSQKSIWQLVPTSCCERLLLVQNMFHFFRGNFLRDLKLKDRAGSWLELALQPRHLERTVLRRLLFSSQRFWPILLEFPDQGPEEG